MALTIENKVIDKFVEQLKGAKRIVLVSHQNPDGDAVGSMLGLYHWLRANPELTGGRISLLLPHPIPHDASYLPGSEEIINATEDVRRCEREIEEADMIIGLDINAAKRTGSMERQIVESKAHKALIDHHLYPDTEVFDPVISIADLSSTCELLYWVMMQIGGLPMLKRETARCLYHGIITDTGGLSYANEDGTLYEAVGTLVGFDVHPAEVHNRVFNSYSCTKMRILTYLLHEKMKIYEKEGFAYMGISASELESMGGKAEDLEGLVNYTLMMEEIEVGAFAKETEGKTRISFRSKGGYNVEEFARKYFEGGGHIKASGATSRWGYEETVSKMERAMLEELRAYRAQKEEDR